MSARADGGQAGWTVAVHDAPGACAIEARCPGERAQCGELAGGADAGEVLQHARELLPAGASLREIRVASERGARALAAAEMPRLALVTTRDLARVLGGEAGDPLAGLPPFERRTDVAEEVRADGSVVTIPQLEDFVPALEQAVAKGITACAISFANAAVYPVHEQLVLTHAHRSGFEHVSAGYEAAPDEPFADRTRAALTEAALAPTIGAFVDAWVEAVAASGSGARLRFIGRGGEVLEREDYRGLLASASPLTGDPSGSLQGLFEPVVHARMHHAVNVPLAGADEASLRMIAASLRERAFAALAARGVRDADVLWRCTATVGSSEKRMERDFTSGSLAALREGPAPFDRGDAMLLELSVDAIEDSGVAEAG